MICLSWKSYKKPRFDCFFPFFMTTFLSTVVPKMLSTYMMYAFPIRFMVCMMYAFLNSAFYTQQSIKLGDCSYEKYYPA